MIITLESDLQDGKWLFKYKEVLELDTYEGG